MYMVTQKQRDKMLNHIATLEAELDAANAKLKWLEKHAPNYKSWIRWAEKNERAEAVADE